MLSLQAMEESTNSNWEDLEIKKPVRKKSKVRKKKPAKTSEREATEKLICQHTFPSWMTPEQKAIERKYLNAINIFFKKGEDFLSNPKNYSGQEKLELLLEAQQRTMVMEELQELHTLFI